VVFLRNQGSLPEKLVVGEGVGDVGRMKKGLQHIVIFHRGGWWWRRRRRRFNDCTITVTVVIVGLLLLEGVNSIEIEDIRRRRRLLRNEMKVVIIVVTIEVVNVRSGG